MANRILRDWTLSDKVDSLSVHAEVFFTRLIMKVDDYGCFNADTRILKASLFPLKLEKIREADIARWTAECEKAGVIVLYVSANKRYLQIQDFRQRLDKAKSKFPLPISNDSLSVVTDFPPEKKPKLETETETESEKLSPAEPTVSELVKYNSIEKNKNSVIEFLKQDPKPTIIEPYVFIWNVFAQENNLSEIKVMAEKRKKKLNARIREKPFDIIQVLSMAKKSAFILSSNWFSFDWIIENETNYMKVIEGNYSNKEKVQNGRENNWGNSSKTNAASIGKNIDYGASV